MNAKSVKFNILILEVLKKKIQVIPVILVVPPFQDGMGISGTRTQKRLPEGDDFISTQMDFYGTDNWKEHYANWDVKPDRQ